MRISDSSQQTFGQIRNSITDQGGDAMLRRIKPQKLSKFVAKLTEADNNPANIDFYIKEGDDIFWSKMRADISYNSDYFNYKKTYKQGLFSNAYKFFAKMCKKADKVNERREVAEVRYKMFLTKYGLEK